MIYTCAVCHNLRFTRREETTGMAHTIRPVPWSLKMEDSYCCSQCVADNDGPGKFEAYARDTQGFVTRGDLARCLLLYAWSMESSEDDYMSSEGYGYCGRFGQYLLFEDTQGFVSYEDCGTEEEAGKEFQRLYSDGMGADETDAYIEFSRGGYAVSFDGKPLDIWPRSECDAISKRRAIARVRLESMRTGYYPNLWEVSDHGNLSLVSY